MLLRSILRLASEEFLVLAAINSHACSKKIRVVALTNSRASSEKICADDQFALTPNKFIYLLWPIFALFWVLVLARTGSGKNFVIVPASSRAYFAPILARVLTQARAYEKSSRLLWESYLTPVRALALDHSCTCSKTFLH